LFLLCSTEKIQQEFKFFLRLHRIFAARPNVTPIVVTTALGPNGRRTVWYQPPDDEPAETADASQPTATATPSSTGPLTPARVFGADITHNVGNTNVAEPTTPATSGTGKKQPKASSISNDALEKACANIVKVPQKRTLLDTLVEIQQYGFRFCVMFHHC
jgi:hypothetical protein